MRKIRAGAAVAALVVALAAAVLELWRPEALAPETPAPRPIVSSRVRLEPVPPAVPAPVEHADAATPVQRSGSARPGKDSSLEENDLRALEDAALQQIDVGPLLRAAGIDAAALQARPDGNDILRHVAADELLTRSMMRDLFAGTIYPYGYPRDRALDDARSAANRMVAALSVEARIQLLETALRDGSSAEPEPSFYGAESGQTFAEGDRGDNPPE